MDVVNLSLSLSLYQEDQAWLSSRSDPNAPDSILKSQHGTSGMQHHQQDMAWHNPPGGAIQEVGSAGT